MLPFPILVFLGTGMGLLVFSLPSSRKRIAQKNIEVCFPNLSSDEQYALLRKNFISMGIAIMEVGMAWWWSKRRLKKLITYDGLEHLTSVPSGQGTMLLGIHFTTWRSVAPLWQWRRKWTVCIERMATQFMIMFKPVGEYLRGVETLWYLNEGMLGVV
jgi:lauroyl/myristoyl acyltransferase